MTVVKVGLDQWIITTNHDVQLATNGLSGCVLLGLYNDTRVGLAHVSSACNRDNWNAYKAQLDKLVASMDGGIVGAITAMSDGTPPVLCQIIQTWCEDKNIPYAYYETSGGCLYWDGAYAKFEKYSTNNAQLYTQGYKTTDDADGLIDKWGKLSDDALAAG